MPELPSGPRDKDLDILAFETAYQGYFRLDRVTFRHRLFSGHWSPVLTREVFQRGHAAAVLPYDPRRDEVVLIEQFRVGAWAAGRDPWLWETVAGIIGPGESKDAVVRREAVEEAGCLISDLEPISDLLVSPGGTSETVMIYCGRVDASQVAGIHGLASEGEDIRPFALSFDEALAAVHSGKIANASSVVALYWLALNKERLQKRWDEHPSRSK